MWDIRTYKCLQTITDTAVYWPENKVSTVLYNPARKAIVTASTKLKQWQYASREVPEQAKSRMRSRPVVPRCEERKACPAQVQSAASVPDPLGERPCASGTHVTQEAGSRARTHGTAAARLSTRLRQWRPAAAPCQHSPATQVDHLKEA